MQSFRNCILDRELSGRIIFRGIIFVKMGALTFHKSTQDIIHGVTRPRAPTSTYERIMVYIITLNMNPGNTLKLKILIFSVSSIMLFSAFAASIERVLYSFH